MEEVKDKKKKLTLKNFSGGAAAISSYAKGSGNKSVLVEKKKNRSVDASYNAEKAKVSAAPQDAVKTNSKAVLLTLLAGVLLT